MLFFPNRLKITIYIFCPLSFLLETKIQLLYLTDQRKIISGWLSVWRIVGIWRMEAGDGKKTQQ